MVNIKTIRNIINNDPKEVLNLGTFTAIKISPLAQKFVKDYSHRNLVDKKAYKSLEFFHRTIDSFFKEIYGHKSGKTTVTSGSTESILLALYAARENGKQKGIKKPNILIPEHAHYSFFKVAHLLNIEVRSVKLNERYSFDINDAKKKINKNTILVVGILGSTELGVIDDLKQIDQLAQQNKIPLHVDAAIGGFIIPFINSTVPYKFTQLKSLISINISGHKFGLSLPGCGILLVRNKKWSEKTSGSLDYLSSGKSLIEGLLITSNSTPMVSLALNILEYQFEGYQKFAKKYLEIKRQLVEELTSVGMDIHIGSPYTPQFFVYGEKTLALSHYLSKSGWTQSTSTPKGLNQPGIRIVIKHGQEETLIGKFLEEVRNFSRGESRQHSYVSQFLRVNILRRERNV